MNLTHCEEFGHTWILMKNYCYFCGKELQTKSSKLHEVADCWCGNYHPKIEEIEK